MPVTINSNVASLNAQRRLAENTASLSHVFTRLSSGLRIVRASDDAAGLSIASSLRVDSRIAAQGIRNVNDGISALNIADGAAQELVNVVIRIVELAEQAANGTLSNRQRQALDKEAVALRKEFNRIVNTTSFNSLQLLSDTATSFDIQAGMSSIALERTTMTAGLVGDGTLSLGQSLATVGITQGATGEDFNGDGFVDLAMASQFDGRIWTMLGNGDGTFKARTSFAGGGGASTGTLDSGDLNGDGIIDIVSATSGSVAVLLGNSNGTFRAPVDYAQAGSIVARIGDFNGDTLNDVVSYTSGTTYLRLGNGDGTLRAATSYAGGVNGADLAVGDVNADGLSDVVMSHGSGGGTSRLYLGTSSGGLQFAGSYTNSGIGAAIGDFNGDGNQDLAISGTVLRIALGYGDGTFQTERQYSLSGNAGTPIANDINGDGYTDLYVANDVTNVIDILLANADGSFKAPRSFATVPGYATEMVVDDFNGDFVPDVAMFGNNGAAAGRIHLGNTDSSPFLPSISLATQDDALRGLARMKDSLNYITGYVGRIGASRSRLDTTVNNLMQQRINYEEAASRIEDIDVAVASSELVRRTILQQAASAILAQANQLPQIALTLLQP